MGGDASPEHFAPSEFIAATLPQARCSSNCAGWAGGAVRRSEWHKGLAARPWPGTAPLLCTVSVGIGNTWTTQESQCLDVQVSVGSSKSAYLGCEQKHGKMYRGKKLDQ